MMNTAKFGKMQSSMSNQKRQQQHNRSGQQADFGGGERIIRTFESMFGRLGL
jgi:hypothetical protein